MNFYQYVNTRMGTFNSHRFSNGNVYPVTAVPHGMASFTIQNENASPRWFYSPRSKSFEGIRLTHQPSPWMGDYGNLIITGQRGEMLLSEENRWSCYDNERCVMEPAYMKGYVYRDRYTFELAPSNSGAVIRFTFEEEGRNRVNLIGDSVTQFECDGEWITGYTNKSMNPVPCGELREYFAVRLNVPFTFSVHGNAISLLAREKRLEVGVATSFLSVAQAKLNYQREIEGNTLEELRTRATDAWESYLSRIAVEDDDEEKKAVFYTCMYRAFLFPRKFYETDEAGTPRHVNLHSGKTVEGVMYADNGFWDTYRTLFPFLSLIDTELYREMAEGFYQYYLDSGWLPKWLSPANVCCMPGMLVEAVMADAIVKEIITGDLAENVFKALLHDGESCSDESGYGRTGALAYRRYGYVPYTVAKESVNETLDCCYGDYCIAMAAQKLGHTEEAERYFGYAKNYKKIFDPESGFMRGKDEEGKFRPAFNSFDWGNDYTEGSAWQSSFAVYHDVAGLNELYGGKLAQKIDEMMEKPAQYQVGGYGKEIHEMSEMADGGSLCAISNQPSFHIPYIYSELGDVEKTAACVQKFAGYFRNTFEGFPGDEDNGSMSSWYLFACFGFYPMSPSRPDFTMSLPLMKKITVKLANGNVLTIDRDRYCSERMKNKVTYEELMRGGELAEMVRK
jgi:predicted alpha-1,2-mannosidase